VRSRGEKKTFFFLVTSKGPHVPESWQVRGHIWKKKKES